MLLLMPLSADWVDAVVVAVDDNDGVRREVVGEEMLPPIGR